MPRGSPTARSTADLELLISLVSQHVHDVECPGRSGVIRQRKTYAWNSVEQGFNTSTKRSRRATRHELQILWNSLKIKTRRQRKSVGPSVPLKDRLTAAVERILPNDGQRHPQSDDESSTESEEETPGNDANSVENGAEVPIGRGFTVDYCPRQQFLTPAPTPDNGTQSSNPPHPTPEVHSRSSLCPSLRPLYQRQTVSEPFGQSQSPFRPIGNCTPSVQSPSLALNTPSSFPSTGMSPRFTVYAPPISAIGSSGNLPRTPFRVPPITGLPAQPQPVSQPPLRIDDASRIHLFQDGQTQMRIKHIQALAAMEKTLHENKIRMGEMLENWARELHEAKMQSNAASCERNEAMDKLLQKRDEELHSAKMLSEEMAANKQRELHDIKIETAKVEHQMAQINKRIVEVKLEQAEMELKNFKENGQPGITTNGV